MPLKHELNCFVVDSESMKYPPVCSAHWEGAVGQWLRGQLDARGIDALAYGRYVLSLLTRPLDPADLSPSPIGNKVVKILIYCLFSLLICEFFATLLCFFRIGSDEISQIGLL